MAEMRYGEIGDVPENGYIVVENGLYRLTDEENYGGYVAIKEYECDYDREGNMRCAKVPHNPDEDLVFYGGDFVNYVVLSH